MNDPISYFATLCATQKFSGRGVVAQLELAEIMEKDGFVVAREVTAGYIGRHGQVRQGRVDLVAIREGCLVGIEIDSCMMPKSKSVKKLIQFRELTHRIVLLNHAPGLFGASVVFPLAVQNLKHGIDFAAHLDVSMASASVDASVVTEAQRKLSRRPCWLPSSAFNFQLF